MKMIIYFLGILLILGGSVGAQTNSPAGAIAVTTLPPDVLMTRLGTVYAQFRVERADPAGLVISYVPAGGGIGLEKIPFPYLPEDWQKHYGYDSQKAAKFNLEQLQALAQWREKMIADEQAYREKRAQQEAEEAAAEQARREAEAAKKAAEAAAALGTNAPVVLATNVPAIQNTNAPAMTDTNQPPPSPPGGH